VDFGPLFIIAYFEKANLATGGTSAMKKVTELVAELAAPAVADAGCTLWDVEYLREAGTWYLRLYIDKEGGVNILDCEKVSHAVEPLLDEADPIEGSYTFEVSSAGAERALKRPSDFRQFLNSPVTVKLYQNRDGRKEFAGTLKDYDEESGAVTITVGSTEMTFSKAETALVRLRVEI
jgi:ribosome maturation factor RimP